MSLLFAMSPLPLSNHREADDGRGDGGAPEPRGPCPGPLAPPDPTPPRAIVPPSSGFAQASSTLPQGRGGVKGACLAICKEPTSLLFFQPAPPTMKLRLDFETLGGGGRDHPATFLEPAAVWPSGSLREVPIPPHSPPPQSPPTPRLKAGPRPAAPPTGGPPRPDPRAPVQPPHHHHRPPLLPRPPHPLLLFPTFPPTLRCVRTDFVSLSKTVIHHHSCAHRRIDALWGPVAALPLSCRWSVEPH